MTAEAHIPVLLSASSALPRRDALGEYLIEAEKAEQRGYFLPDEDERLREVYGRYLAVRSSLLESLSEVSGGKLSHRSTQRLEDFVVAFAAACLLVRSANFIVELARHSPILRKKLDEPEPRFGLGGKQFTEIYQHVTAPQRWWAFFEAVRYYRSQRERILQLRQDSTYGPVVELLLAEEAFVEVRRKDFLKHRYGYRLHSFVRRNHSGYRKAMFTLFKLSGSVISELKQPFVKPRGMGKRVSPEVRARLEAFLRPGDVLVTRHDDAVSNLFLPGFWPHAAFYIGQAEQRQALGVRGDAEIGPQMRFIEAKKDGVKIRPADDTLQVDAFIVLRPKLKEGDVAEAVSRALTHAGKLYDFIFDFSSAERLACTELVYRSYHSVGAVDFALQPHAGRQCLSAEDLIDQAVARNWFEPVLAYGVRGDEWIEGSEAVDLLRASYASNF